jgi:hypothetical protein
MSAIEWCGQGPEVEADEDVTGWNGDKFTCHELRDTQRGKTGREKFKWGKNGYLSVKTRTGRIKVDQNTETDWEVDGTSVRVTGPDVEWQIG